MQLIWGYNVGDRYTELIVIMKWAGAARLTHMLGRSCATTSGFTVHSPGNNGVRCSKILIDVNRASDLRFRNVWVRGSTSLHSHQLPSAA